MTASLPDPLALRILETLAEAVTVQDERGKTVYANEAAVRLLGAESIDEILVAEPGDLAARFLILKEDGSRAGAEDFPGRRLMRGENFPQLVTRSVRLESGREIWAVTKATLVEHEGRRWAVNIIEDVTAAKTAELRQRFLLEATAALSSSLDYERTLQRIAELAVPTLSDWCTVHLPDERDGIRQVALAHGDPDKVRWAREIGQRYPPQPDAPQGLPVVLATGRPELYPDIPDELLRLGARDPEHYRLLRDVGMRSVMIVPMLAGETVVGAITFIATESRKSFDRDDLEFAQDLGARAGIAVENARLYTERAQVARTLQQSLLPESLPPTPGWEVRTSYTPGETGSEVGGDFYDVFPAGDGLMVLLGDVTGKGVAAAALTSTARHTARTAALFDPDPSSVLALVNRVLREQPRMSPVTLVCARLDPAPGGAEMKVASAGHPLPLVRRAGGEVVRAGRTDVLLGVVDASDWPAQRVAIAPGDTVLFYTDGVTDVAGRDGRLGEAGLLAVLEGADAAPEAIIGAVERAVLDVQGPRGADDRAMLALRHVGA